jgi:DNA-binding response OmpR family regulator
MDVPRPLKILIVDDDQAMVRTLEMRLTRAGFLVESVLDGATALAVLKKKPFDLVILDLVMPAMPGFEVLKEMRKNDAKTPVAVLSLLHQEEDVERTKQLGATAYFSKSSPAFLDDLVKYAVALSIA